MGQFHNDRLTSGRCPQLLRLNVHHSSQDHQRAEHDDITIATCVCACVEFADRFNNASDIVINFTATGELGIYLLESQASSLNQQVLQASAADHALANAPISFGHPPRLFGPSSIHEPSSLRPPPLAAS